MLYVVQVSEVNCEDYDLPNVAIHEVSNVNHTMQNDVHNPNSVCQYPMIPIQSDNHIVNDGEDLLYATPIPYSHESVKPDLVERHSYADVVVVHPGRYDNVCTGNVTGQSLSDVPEAQNITVIEGRTRRVQRTRREPTNSTRTVRQTATKACYPHRRQPHDQTPIVSYTENESVSLENDIRFDISDYIRKRPKRFYIGGFLPSITETKVAMYVSRRGPKVSQVSIFRNKYKPTVIRLNVEDDENVTLLDDPEFWPDGVICRPWMTNNQYRTGGANRSRRRSNQAVDRSRDRRATETQHVTYSDYNPFENLSGEVD